MTFDKKCLEYNESVIGAIMAGKMDYVCYGGGSYFCAFLNKYCAGDKKFPYPKFVCDSNSQKWGQYIDGIEIKSPDAMLEVDLEKTVIVLSVVLPQGIVDVLYSEKYQRHYHRIIMLRQIEAFFIVQEKRENLQDVYDLLEDEDSKYRYNEYFSSLLHGTFLCPLIYSPNAYWNNDLVPRLGETGVVYAGAFDGKHINRALSSNPKCTMYAFEPNEPMYKKLLPKYSQYNNVNIFPYALFDCECQLVFDPTYALGAKIIDPKKVDTKNDQGLEIVNARKMDDVIGDKKIGQIALDVEGTELKAIQGAAHIIESNRPKLSICLYHKLEDYYEIPLYIHNNYPEYKLHFRHHSPAIIESVLYAL